MSLNDGNCFCQVTLNGLNSLDYQMTIRKAASLFLQLLQARKVFKIQLSTIHLVCEVAKTLKYDQDLESVLRKSTLDQSTQTNVQTHVLTDEEEQEEEEEAQDNIQVFSTANLDCLSSNLYLSLSATPKQADPHLIGLNLKQIGNENSQEATLQAPTGVDLDLNRGWDGLESKFVFDQEKEDVRQQCDLAEAISLEPPKPQLDEPLPPTLPCPHCDKTFPSKDAISAHINVSHKKYRRLECEVCERSFRNSHQFAQHKRKCQRPEEKQYMCAMCGQLFKDLVTFSQHAQSMHSQVEKALQVPSVQLRDETRLATTVQASNVQTTNYTDVQVHYTTTQAITNDAIVQATNYTMAQAAINDSIVQATNTRTMQTKDDNECQNHNGEPEKEADGLDPDDASSTLIQLLQDKPRSKRRRRRKATLQDKLICLICKKRIDTKAAMVAHMRRHTTRKDFRCEFCSKQFAKLEQLKAHRAQHAGDRPYTCDVCGKMFKTQGSIRAHLATHSGRFPYKCDICGKAYSQTCGLNAHKLKHTAEEEMTASSKPEQSASSLDQHKCHICGRTYKTSKRLTEHAKFHNSKSDKKCDFCDKKFFSVRDLIVHSRVHTQDKYTCRTCGANFKSRSTYYFHTQTHPGERPHMCTVCGKSFTRIYDLKIHQRKHTEEDQEREIEQHPCSLCDRVYQTKNSLQMHMKVHLGIFDHPCQFCDKKFKSHAELRHHTRTHTKERPYTCEVCQKSFSRQSTLVNHRRTHSGERPYLCMVCGSAFKLACTLKKHQKVHLNEARGKGKGRAKHRILTTALQPEETVVSVEMPQEPEDSMEEPNLISMVPVAPTKPLPALPQPVKLTLTTQTLPTLSATPSVKTTHQLVHTIRPSQHLILTHNLKHQDLSSLLLQQQQQQQQQLQINNAPSGSSLTTTLFNNNNHNLIGINNGQTLVNRLRGINTAGLQLQQVQPIQNVLDLASPPTISITNNLLQLREPSGSGDLLQLRETNTGLTAIRTFLTSSDLDLHHPARSLMDTDLDLRDSERSVIEPRPASSPSNLLQLDAANNLQTYYFF